MSSPKTGAAPTTPAGPVLLTVAEVGNRLRLKPAAVRALTSRGEIAFFRIGRSLRFQSEDVEAYLERQRRPARGDRALQTIGLYEASDFRAVDRPGLRDVNKL